MSENPSDKHYDLEERTEEFTANTANVCNTLPKNTSNIEYIKQVIRSSGSVASNYIEANEALSKKDFLYRIKICRKEAKESAMWLRTLVKTNVQEYHNKLNILQNEAVELKKIFSAIINKSGG